VPLAFVAFMLLGNAVLKFMFALFSLSSGFSAGKLADAPDRPGRGRADLLRAALDLRPPQIEEEVGTPRRPTVPVRPRRGPAAPGIPYRYPLTIASTTQQSMIDATVSRECLVLGSYKIFVAGDRHEVS
jgi:hypothetical protein